MLRPCIVDGKPALFHRWFAQKEVAPDVLSVGNERFYELLMPHVVTDTCLGIVEFEDGTVLTVYPSYIKFTDSVEKFKECYK